MREKRRNRQHSIHVETMELCESKRFNGCLPLTDRSAAWISDSLTRQNQPLRQRPVSPGTVCVSRDKASHQHMELLLASLLEPRAHTGDFGRNVISPNQRRFPFLKRTARVQTKLAGRSDSLDDSSDLRVPFFCRTVAVTSDDCRR